MRLIAPLLWRRCHCGASALCQWKCLCVGKWESRATHLVQYGTKYDWKWICLFSSGHNFHPFYLEMKNMYRTLLHQEFKGSKHGCRRTHEVVMVKDATYGAEHYHRLLAQEDLSISWCCCMDWRHHTGSISSVTLSTWRCFQSCWKKTCINREHTHFNYWHDNIALSSKALSRSETIGQLMCPCITGQTACAGI